MGPVSASLPLFDDVPSVEGLAEDMLRRARAADAGHFDELRQGPTQLRAPWQEFLSHLGAPLEDLQRRQATLQRQIREDGITYNVYNAEGGPNRPWSLEVLPQIIEAQEWRELEQGVVQRARLLNAVALDVYGSQQVMREALLPPALVLGHPGYLRAMQGVRPPGDVFLHVVAFDLVRGPDQQWWVVSHRTQAPSGLGYVMQNRLIVSRMFGDAYRAMHVQHLASGYRRMIDTLQALATRCAQGRAPRLALLTPGIFNETYFEQAYLARYLGLPLVEGGDLVVRDERLYLKTVQGLEPIHGLLRRLDDDFCDPLELRTDSTLGVPGLMQVVRAGHVVLANALGTGFLESPAIHGFMPALSRRLLGQPLQLPSLPSWWCGEAAAWEDIQDDLANQVIRPSYPSAGQVGFGEPPLKQSFDAVLGRRLNAVSLQAWHARIEQDPGAFTLQSFVPYSQAPVWHEGKISPRGASLRVYALADGQGGWQVLPGGMTRIATRDAGPVSMQLGGSSLDTWVLTDDAVDNYSMLVPALSWENLVERQRPVASRIGESLFWMGRYSERVEQQLRLVGALVRLQSSEDDSDEALLQALDALSRACGLVPQATPSLMRAPRVFERAVLDGLAEAAPGPGVWSLSTNLAMLKQSALTLRERLSPVHARLLRGLGEDFLQALAQDAPQGPPGLVQAQDALERLAVQLSAVTGAQSDGMTRDVGWRLLTVGRLIERLVGQARMLQVFWRQRALHTPQGFDQLLELFDSAITFRARFQRRLELPALLALLVMDDSNPRALACVVRRLRTELGKLPLRNPQAEDLTRWLPRQGLGVELRQLCDDKEGEQRVAELLDGLLDLSWRLSDEVGRQFFVHGEPNGAMVST